jgi:hypothetical protein
MEQYGWYCEGCERWAVKGKAFLPLFEVDKIVRFHKLQRLDIPVIHHNGTVEPCIICGYPHTEQHHIAPQAYEHLFGEEWNQWPVIPLCPLHHKKWHEIVTPTLVKKSLDYGKA